jgi:hypothetical protein
MNTRKNPKYGIVSYNGIAYALLQDAAYLNNVSYAAVAVLLSDYIQDQDNYDDYDLQQRDDGKYYDTYLVTWEILDSYIAAHSDDDAAGDWDESTACDWGKPMSVRVL